MRVLIAPDKFKGSLTAAEVADHLGKGLAEAGANTRTLPLADGGDGSVAAALASGFHPLPVEVHGATGEQHRGLVAFDDHTAIVEVANTCGLATLPGGVRAPMTASSYGFGEAIRAALTLSPQRLVLALGGSASTDGGVGMLAALGYRFLDRAGDLLAPIAANLDHIHCVDSRHAIDLRGSSSPSPVMSRARCSDSPAPPPYSDLKKAPQQPKSPSSTPACTTLSMHWADPDRPRRNLRARLRLWGRRRHRFRRHAAGRHHDLRCGILSGPTELRSARRRCRSGHHRRRAARQSDIAGQASRRGRTARGSHSCHSSGRS